MIRLIRCEGNKTLTWLTDTGDNKTLTTMAQDSRNLFPLTLTLVVSFPSRSPDRHDLIDDAHHQHRRLRRLFRSHRALLSRRQRWVNNGNIFTEWCKIIPAKFGELSLNFPNWRIDCAWGGQVAWLHWGGKFQICRNTFSHLCIQIEAWGLNKLRSLRAGLSLRPSDLRFMGQFGALFCYAASMNMQEPHSLLFWQGHETITKSDIVRE